LRCIWNCHLWFGSSTKSSQYFVKSREQTRITANTQLLHNESVSQPFNQTANQSASQCVEKCTTTRAVRWCSSQPGNQQVNQSSRQLASRSVCAERDTRSVRHRRGEKNGCRCVTSDSTLLSGVSGSTNSTKIKNYNC